jgi:N-methylhydantoinase B
MGDHMPVHLGSMPMSVAAALDALELGPGDIAMLNDPYAGGTHLPDITLAMPMWAPATLARSRPGVPSRVILDVGKPNEPPHPRPLSPKGARGEVILYPPPLGGEGGGHAPPGEGVSTKVNEKARQRPSFYVANRAHHADMGGAQPTSMGLSLEIYQEGLRIPPVVLARGGKIQRDVLAILLANVRTPREREGDLMAQVAACRLGSAACKNCCKDMEPRGPGSTWRPCSHTPLG